MCFIWSTVTVRCSVLACSIPHFNTFIMSFTDKVVVSSMYRTPVINALRITMAKSVNENKFFQPLKLLTNFQAFSSPRSCLKWTKILNYSDTNMWKGLKVLQVVLVFIDMFIGEEFFFWWSLTNQQLVEVSNGYLAWCFTRPLKNFNISKMLAQNKRLDRVTDLWAPQLGAQNTTDCPKT